MRQYNSTWAIEESNGLCQILVLPLAGRMIANTLLTFLLSLCGENSTRYILAQLVQSLAYNGCSIKLSYLPFPLISTCWFQLRVILLGGCHGTIIYIFMLCPLHSSLCFCPLLTKVPSDFPLHCLEKKPMTQVTQMTIQNGHIRGQQEGISTFTPHFYHTHASSPSLLVSQWENDKREKHWSNPKRKWR